MFGPVSRDGWGSLIQVLLDIKAQLIIKPDLRQGVVSDVAAGPPVTCTLTIGGHAYPGTRCLASYSPVDGDTVWAFVRQSGVRIIIGDLA